jgi:hypothetical protein
VIPVHRVACACMRGGEREIQSINCVDSGVSGVLNLRVGEKCG